MKYRIGPILVLLQSAYAWQGDHWVATWTTAQDVARLQPAAAPATPPTTPRPAPPSGRRGLNNQTVRMIVHTSIGGGRVRIKLASAFGAAPVTFGAAHVALRSKDSEIVPGSDRALTFSGWRALPSGMAW
jgi:hypothetical protein